MLSIVITAHNEGEELGLTLRSIHESMGSPYEVVVVDDGSTDGSCEGVEGPHVRVVRHEERIGVAWSRNRGCEAARGDVLAFLDGHQRLSPGCLDRCAKVARGYGAVVWPDVEGLEHNGWTGHGACFRLCPTHGYFTGRWNHRRPEQAISRIHTLITPGYVMTREVYEKVRWVDALRKWGASEASIALKAFFLDVDLLHLCGPMARHRFRRQFPYSTPWSSVWRNQALLARVLFDDETWSGYWLPQVFQRYMTRELHDLLHSPEVLAEHRAFLARKVRPDREFWRGVLHQEEPECLRPRPPSRS